MYESEVSVVIRTFGQGGALPFLSLQHKENRAGVHNDQLFL